jgi:hypothetical protein
MTWLNNRVTRLEGALAVGALIAAKPGQVRVLLSELEWREVPIGSLIHIGGNPPRVFRYMGGYDPVSSSCQAEEVDLLYDRSWGLQPVDYVVLDI